MNKNIPNYLTIFRMFLVIPFVILFAFPAFNSFPNFSDFPKYSKNNWQLYCIIAAGIIFILAMLTDFLDGYLARKYKVVSTFGQFFDPIADKFITNSAIIIFAVYHVIPIWIVVPILLRDTFVDGMRMIAAKNKVVIGASFFGKLKTFTLTLVISILFFILPLQSINITSWEIWLINIPLIFCLLLSLISGYQYISKIKIKF